MHVESSSWTRDRTWAPPHWVHRGLPTGPPGKSQIAYHFGCYLLNFPCEQSTLFCEMTKVIKRVKCNLTPYGQCSKFIGIVYKSFIKHLLNT